MTSPLADLRKRLRERAWRSTNSLEREQRLRLCERQEWLCYWCQKPMRWIVLGKKGHLPPDAATTDHLDDRLSPERGKHEGEFRRVAAHKRCNEARSNARQQALGIDELHRRSGRAPLEPC
jgi:hypothetical protein